MLNLDTHILVHAMTGNLSTNEERILRRQSWGISGIVFWELAKLVQLGRIQFNFTDTDVAATLRGIHVWPIDLAIARMSTSLDFRADPADEIIAATSIVHGVPLVTRDHRIRRSAMVPFAE